MKDLVIAVYYKDNYAGETILKLEKVLVNEDIPEKYKNYKYQLRVMYLVDYLKSEV